jgi:arylsulfatase A-like enzyme
MDTGTGAIPGQRSAVRNGGPGRRGDLWSTRPMADQAVIGRTVEESTPAWEQFPLPAPGTPNVVVVLLDDTGFGHLGCYGSDIDTPNLDRLASRGLRLTNFHTTAICSASRASLLTGRNHHSVGMRTVSHYNSGFPNTRGRIAHSAGTLAEMLSPLGFATYAVGKWHLAPMAHCSAAGPFGEWPTGRGFDKFYGFLNGETDQFFPELCDGTTFVDPPGTPESGYHLTEDLVDHGIGYIRDLVSLVPERPFFMYMGLGATHAPHQAPPAYLAKYRGRYDEGWDVARERVHRRQLHLGVIPAGTKLSPRNPGVPAWADLTDDQRSFAARLQEAFAAFLDHADAQIGRFLDFLADIGVLDDTIVVVMSDNGASREGLASGVMDEFRFFNGVDEDLTDVIDRLDDIGGPHSHTNYPWGWAQVGNTPCKWYKTMTHAGGVRDPFIVHFPREIRANTAGATRPQFHHVIDVAPTILDILGIEAPATIDGTPQQPIEGTSFRYLFEPGAVDVPSARTTQYFEMHGNRAIWHDGWKAVTQHTPGTPFDEDTWELYRLDSDFSECDDLAASSPDVVQQMIARWWTEAGRYGVLPLDDRPGPVLSAASGVGTPRARQRYDYRPPVSRLSQETVPPLAGRSYRLEAVVDRVDARTGGVLLAIGTMNTGMVIYLDDGHVVYDLNEFNTHTIVRTDRPVPAGRQTLGVAVDRGDGTATVTLSINGVACGAATYPTRLRVFSSIGMDIGRNPTRISDAYEPPGTFAGTIERVTIDVEPPPTPGAAFVEQQVMARVAEGSD